MFVKKKIQMDENNLGTRIRGARKKAGLSQDELAHRLGITMNTVNRYEKGHRLPDANILTRMVEVLNCDPAWLLTGEVADRVAEKISPYYNVSTDPELSEINEWLRDNPKDKKLFLKLVKVKKDVGEAFEGLEFKIILKEEV